MSDKQEPVFSSRVGSQAARKLRAQRDGSKGAWFGLGMSGLIGWSVAVPTLAGVFFGVWLDRRHPTHFSWTLALLVAGLCIGCANVWRWVAQQDEAMKDKATPDE
jgi:ATP synthase protein I